MYASIFQSPDLFLHVLIGLWCCWGCHSPLPGSCSTGCFSGLSASSSTISSWSAAAPVSAGAGGCEPVVGDIIAGTKFGSGSLLPSASCGSTPRGTCPSSAARSTPPSDVDATLGISKNLRFLRGWKRGDSLLPPKLLAALFIPSPNSGKKGTEGNKALSPGASFPVARPGATSAMVSRGFPFTSFFCLRGDTREGEGDRHGPWLSSSLCRSTVSSIFLWKVTLCLHCALLRLCDTSRLLAPTSGEWEVSGTHSGLSHNPESFWISLSFLRSCDLFKFTILLFVSPVSACGKSVPETTSAPSILKHCLALQPPTGAGSWRLFIKRSHSSSSTSELSVLAPVRSTMLGWQPWVLFLDNVPVAEPCSSNADVLGLLGSLSFTLLSLVPVRLAFGASSSLPVEGKASESSSISRGGNSKLLRATCRCVGNPDSTKTLPTSNSSSSSDEDRKMIPLSFCTFCFLLCLLSASACGLMWLERCDFTCCLLLLSMPLLCLANLRSWARGCWLGDLWIVAAPNTGLVDLLSSTVSESTAGLLELLVDSAGWTPQVLLGNTGLLKYNFEYYYLKKKKNPNNVHEQLSQRWKILYSV